MCPGVLLGTVNGTERMGKETGRWIPQWIMSPALHMLNSAKEERPSFGQDGEFQGRLHSLSSDERVRRGLRLEGLAASTP